MIIDLIEWLRNKINKMEPLDLMAYRYFNGLAAPSIPLKLISIAPKLDYEVRPQRCSLAQLKGN